jgi:hypothetical protein
MPRRYPQFKQLTASFLDFQHELTCRLWCPHKCRVEFQNSRTYQPVFFSARVDLPPVVPPEEDDNAGTCIICVGSTGTGKSSTIAKFTGAQFESFLLSSSFASLFADIVTGPHPQHPFSWYKQMSLPHKEKKQTYREGRELAIIAVLADGEMGVKLILTSPKSGIFFN